MGTQAGSVGVLLINLGTPDSPEVGDVRRYLREFLMDGRVIDMPAVPRWLLVNGVIAPFRAPKSAHAYKSVWTREGSPLMVHSRALEAEVRAGLPGVPVALAMRYGRPSIADGVAALGDVARIVAVPLYPQYASSTTGTALEALYDVLGARVGVPSVAVVPPFWASPGWLDASAAVAREAVDGADWVLFSFHGLPVSHIKTADSGCRLDDLCCGRVPPFCYRAQCLATARALAERLVPGSDRWSVAFQSRLGRAEWLTPATEAVLQELPKKGVKTLAVLTPSFVSDCLETVEEIGLRGAEVFKDAGGVDFRRAPCVNADPAWAAALVGTIRAAL